MKKEVHFQNLGMVSFKEAWELQEQLLAENVRVKTELRKAELASSHPDTFESPHPVFTKNHLLFCWR